MAQYIDKSALVAEIERIKKEECPTDTYEGRCKLFWFEQFLSFLNTLEVKEEPVSEDLEEAAWMYYDKNRPPIPQEWDLHKEFIDFFKDGAQWQKEQMIDKACEWLKSYRQDTPDGTGYVAGIVNDKTIEEFKQAMEE